MEIVIFIFITFGAFALMFFYGIIRLEEGFKNGYSKGYFDGHVKGSYDVICLYEDMGIINLEELTEKIQSGEYDHIGDIAKLRKIYFNK